MLKKKEKKRTILHEDGNTDTQLLGPKTKLETLQATKPKKIKLLGPKTKISRNCNQNPILSN